jgi:regulator of sigma E protease
MSGGVAITVFAVSLLVAIMLHELGHFVTARRFGMRADRYFLGFGPTLWSMRRGETEYGIKAIPAGGFVSIRGMTPLDERRQPLPDALFDPDAIASDRRGQARRDGVDLAEVAAVPATTWQRLDHILSERGTPADVRGRIVDRTRRNAGEDPTTDEVRTVLHEVVMTETSDTGRVGDLQHRLVRGDEGRFFHDRPAWQRAIVLAAGSAMHFTIAVLVLLLGLLLLPQPTGEASPVIDQVQAGSAADEAGLQPGDRVLAIAGQESDDFLELREVIRGRPGEPTDVTIRRDGRELTLTITPTRTLDEETGEYVGLLGFVPAQETEQLSLTDAAYETFVGPSSVPAMMGQSLRGIASVFGPEGLGQLFQQVTGEVERGNEGGMSIVGASAVAGQAVAAFGVMSLLYLIASVNVFIGVFNLLPLPPLDGGHLAVLGVERGVNAVRRLRGRAADFTIDARQVAAISLPVIVLFAVVSLGLIWLDITNPIQLQ